MINSVLPGTYVEVRAGETQSLQSTTGVVMMPLALDWGDKVTTIKKGDDTLYTLGYKIYDTKMKLVNEVMNYADQLILYRLNDGVKATATLASGITATALYGGKRGNDLSVTVEDNTGSFTIKTFLDTLEVDSQVVTSISGFRPNLFLTITGTGTLAGKTVKLTGGTSTEANAEAFSGFFQEAPKHSYNVLCYTGTDAETAQSIIGFVKEQRENGDMVQAVLSTNSSPNDKAIINNSVGGITANYELTAAEACATMAGIQAAQGIERSATFYEVKGWQDVTPRLNKVQQEIRTQNGEILFVYRHGKVMVLYDINSLTTYTENNPESFRKNLVVRTIDKYAMDLQVLLDTKVIGKIRNSVDGRNQIKGLIADMTIKNYGDTGAVEGFSADDITVSPGTAKDSVMVTVGLLVTDTTDKIYITVTAQ